MAAREPRAAFREQQLVVWRERADLCDRRKGGMLLGGLACAGFGGYVVWTLGGGILFALLGSALVIAGLTGVARGIRLSGEAKRLRRQAVEQKRRLARRGRERE